LFGEGFQPKRAAASRADWLSAYDCEGQTIMDCYLDPEAAGLPWLLDPASTDLATIANAAVHRTAESHCDAGALCEEVPLLHELILSRHFGLVTGFGDRSGVEKLMAAWRQRLSVQPPATWGAAVGNAQHFLQRSLGDSHLRIVGAASQSKSAPQGIDELDRGPAIEGRTVRDISVVHLRRLFGDQSDEEALNSWVANAEKQFDHDRIIVDLRGNGGGNDGYVYDWASDYVPRGFHDAVSSKGWSVAGHRLSAWNHCAWLELTLGRDNVPSWLLESRHQPSPHDELGFFDDETCIPAGKRPWRGRMLVLVDRATRSSGETAAWFLKNAFGATLAGRPTAGTTEYGDVVPYVLPLSGLVIRLPTTKTDYGFPVEFRGFPVDVSIDFPIALEELAAEFDELTT
jgi:hypothetical protein